MEIKVDFEGGICPSVDLCDVLLKSKTHPNKISPLCLHLSATRVPLLDLGYMGFVSLPSHTLPVSECASYLGNTACSY